MCEELTSLREAAAAVVSRFDPALLAAASLPQVIKEASAIEKMMATLASMAASALAKVGPAKTAKRQAVRQLAQRSGLSLQAAEKALEATGAPVR